MLLPSVSLCLQEIAHLETLIKGRDAIIAEKDVEIADLRSQVTDLEVLNEQLDEALRDIPF